MMGGEEEMETEMREIERGGGRDGYFYSLMTSLPFLSLIVDDN